MLTATHFSQRGRKRKAVYDTANQGAGLGVEDDLEMEGDSTESEPDLTDDDGDIGLDNIIDNAFVDDGIGIDDVAEERERLPSKASQHRPDELGWTLLCEIDNAITSACKACISINSTHGKKKSRDLNLDSDTWLALLHNRYV